MIAVVSPHLDDGVMGCGARVASEPGSVVITVFAGRPRPGAALTPWDAECGFAAGDDVIAARREEDREALSILGATPLWLDFQDAQYGPPPPEEALAEALDRALAAVNPEVVLVPLGLYHGDHVRVSGAALALVRACPGRAFHAYEDAVYRRLPGLTEGALARAAASGVAAAPLPESAPAPELAERKRRAVLCYESQLRGLAARGRPGHADAFAPERCWRLQA